jgi:hypothetical protein
MSSKELLEEANKLLASSWEDDEKALVKRMVDSLISYKSLIPKSFKQDIKAMLQMANRIKTEYDELLQKYKSEQQDDDKVEEVKEVKEIEVEELKEIEVEELKEIEVEELKLEEDKLE